MKNLYYIAIAALLAASAGCSKVEVADAPDKAVTFTVASYSPQTRADDDGYVSVLDQDNVSSFKSRAFLHAAGFTGWSNYFPEAGETISANSTPDPTEWLPSHEYYWPKSPDSYIDFISWHGGEPVIGYSTTTPYTATFEWTNDKEVAPTDNLMWADMACRYHANDNTPVYGKDGVTEGVPTLFHHALAQVRFMGKVSQKSKTENERTVEWTVKITNVSVANVSNKGTFSLSNEDPETDKTAKPWKIEKDWQNLSGAVTLPVKVPTGGFSLSTESTELIGWSNVIPQSTNAVTLSVTYTVETKYASKIVEETVTTPAIPLQNFTESIPNWERNKRYTYTLIIEPDTGVIKIIPVEINWVDGATKEITVE